MAKSQQGAILIVSLLFLVVMTIIGMNAMQGTTLEEKMVHATRDRIAALQSAESAIRSAEAYIEGVASTAVFTGANGLYRRIDAEPDYNASTTWTDTSKYISATEPAGSAASQYFIKYTGEIVGVQGAMNISGYGNNLGTGDVSTFRITARGVGGSANGAEVLLRSHYGRIF